MAHYSIKDLERLSGIQAHTIRIWEKRYKLISPERTTTNIRVYSDNDLKRLLNIAMLNKNGIKISKIAHLSESDLNNKIMKLSEDYSNAGNQIENLVHTMVQLDEIKFENLFNAIIDQMGFEDAIVNVIYPFLSKIGVLWQTGSINPAQEHFISNILRRKILVAIDKLEVPTSNKKFILFLPEGEYHEISLLFFSYLVRKHGFYAIYLGQSVPFSDVVTIQKEYNADYLITCFTTQLPEFSINGYMGQLAKTFKKQKVFVTGGQLLNQDVKRGTSLVKIKSAEHFKQQLNKIK
jgi:MerR family transcriptional regulator, light-induced transcriptional regulator